MEYVSIAPIELIKNNYKSDEVLSYSYNLLKMENSVDNGNNLAFKKTINSTLSRDHPLEEGCIIEQIDWYWQTFINGVLVSEEYLFTTNEIICEGGGGGGGGGSLPPNQQPLYNPCDEADKLGDNSEFQEKISTLITNASGNKEYSYFYSNTTSSTFDETINEGPTNELFVDLTLPSGTIDGMIHNHFSKPGTSLSIYSASDLSTIISVYSNGKMNDPHTFTSTLVTHHGNQYMLKIDNLSKFHAFATTYKSDFIMESMMMLYITPDKIG